MAILKNKPTCVEYPSINLRNIANRLKETAVVINKPGHENFSSSLGFMGLNGFIVPQT